MDIIEASKVGDLERVKELISQGADNFDYALRCASLYGHLEVVKYLVEHGADIHASNNLALRWASKEGHLEVVKYLENIIRERKLLKIRERLALRVIEKGLHNWLWRAECRDGTIGIVPRLDMEKLKLI